MNASLAATQVGVGRFLHGSGALGQLAAEIGAAGGRPFIIGGRVRLDLVSSALPPTASRVVRHERRARGRPLNIMRGTLPRRAPGSSSASAGVTIDLAKARDLAGCR